MCGLEKDTIGGYNGMLDKQRKEEGEVLVSTILFDDRSEVLCDRVPLDKVAPMTEKDYYVRGCTALLDAVGGAIRHIRNIHRYAREEDRPEKTIFVITTDGLENASKRYSYRDVKKMIKRQEEKYGWEFLFLGANIDAAAEAGRIGIASNRASQYVSDGYGSRVAYQSIARAQCETRLTGAPSASWNEEAAADFAARGR
jgi:hypothetical protein